MTSSPGTSQPVETGPAETHLGKLVITPLRSSSDNSNKSPLDGGPSLALSVEHTHSFLHSFLRAFSFSFSLPLSFQEQTHASPPLFVAQGLYLLLFPKPKGPSFGSVTCFLSLFLPWLTPSTTVSF
uniref:Uncharacterized protein n=1 Tax=Pipistrellus kuhlii TaxID=59472 RepID=A0A7J7YXA0_PIPKU|nr:hypothetical protein mPipKuh1_009882 [Pipistrellus kuhlii]